MRVRQYLKMTMIGMGMMSLALSSAPLFAAPVNPVIHANQYNQTIYVANLLANNDLPAPGMTTTPVLVKYFNGAARPCWYLTINYQSDAIVHAGPGQGCAAKVTMIEITPLLVAEKLNTYGAPVTLNIDTTKFSNQVTILQQRAPVFDSASGLVTTPGSIKINYQAQYLD